MERQYTERDVWTMIVMRVIIAYCVAISNTINIFIPNINLSMFK